MFFFHFWPFFHCRKATKMTQNSISIPSCAQTPKNPRKMSKTPPYSGLGAKPFLAPPAKADIATAILTNVIEHLVLLFCPPISTPSPPKRCGRIFPHHIRNVIIQTDFNSIIFQRGRLNHQPVILFYLLFSHQFGICTTSRSNWCLSARRYVKILPRRDQCQYMSR